MTTSKAWSHRDSPNVPDFPDTGSVVFVDGTCGACSKGARLIAKLDKHEKFLICPIGSPLGRQVLLHYGLSPDDPQSWLYLENGVAYQSMEAIIRVGASLGGLGHILKMFNLLPPSWQNALYTWIANNRYRFMGRTDICSIADPALQKRIIG